MTLPTSFIDPAYQIYLSLIQYPVLASRVRVRMRQELFNRGIMSVAEFRQQVNEQAVQSQYREGLSDPYAEEPEDVWRDRREHVRDHLTDLYFSQHIPFSLFEEIVREVLAERGAAGTNDDWIVGLNVELSPSEVLIEQVRQIQKMSPEKLEAYKPRLQEIKVVLIRNMISDQLRYIKIAKKWFTLEDLINIRERKIGKGRIGGKAAGMLLAKRIVEQMKDPAITENIRIPESYYLAADVMYTFMDFNDLMHWAQQKYKTIEDQQDEYPDILAEYAAGKFPPEIENELQDILHKIGNKPLIVRSSSLLEDNFGTSFAGKYDSHFCPNQGTEEENLQAFIRAIALVYASALNPDALTYRRRHDLIDYDERIAILIQEVEGEQIGDYHLPHAAGVAFSRNLYRWSPQIERDAGFVRLVWGMGTRAVDRVGNDYPRLVALSHPLLHSHDDPRAVVHYSQKYVDLIDLKSNEFKTLPIGEVLHRRYGMLRYIARRYQDGYLAPIRTNLLGEDAFADVVITFDEFLRRSPFAERMSAMLQYLEKQYHAPVDMEFAVRVKNTNSTTPEIQISILQCRPQSHLEDIKVGIPNKITKRNLVFDTKHVLFSGYVPDIRYVAFVSPKGYFSLKTPADRNALTRAIGQLNAKLENENFICIGPGRWGTTNPDLGVRIGYGDIYHAKALIEMSGKGVGSAPEPSFGTHFFQDLIEARVLPLALFLDDVDSVFNEDFFYQLPNRVSDWLPNTEKLKGCLYLLDVEDFRKNHRLSLILDDDIPRGVLTVNPKTEEESQPESEEKPE